jgi:thiol-disulfide isomerase/thioredoxin
VNLLLLTTDISTRAFWAVVIIAVGLAIYWLVNWYILNRAQKKGLTQTQNLPGARPGVPAILYFTSPDCVPCKTVQRPALQKLKDRLGDRLQVIEVNTQENPDLATRWGVLSVPTTFIIDRQGKLLFVNHGATRTEKLLEQMHVSMQ